MTGIGCCPFGSSSSSGLADDDEMPLLLHLLDPPPAQTSITMANLVVTVEAATAEQHMLIVNHENAQNSKSSHQEEEYDSSGITTVAQQQWLEGVRGMVVWLFPLSALSCVKTGVIARRMCHQVLARMPGRVGHMYMLYRGELTLFKIDSFVLSFTFSYSYSPL